MKRISIYADFDFLSSPQEIGVLGYEHVRGKDSVFGFVKDSFPDRWGRLLLDRRERIMAFCSRQRDGRSLLPTTLTQEQSHINAC